MSNSNHNPTPEQAAALAAFSTGQNVVLEAGAGTGKTSTLLLMGESTDRKGLYLAYNKAIQVEASKKFPANVECRTAHSLAYGPIVARTPAFKARMNANARLSINDLANRLGVQGSVALNDEESLDRRDLTRLAFATVDRFCQSADTEVAKRHVPLVPNATEVQRDKITAFVLPVARKAWDDLSSETGTLPWGKKGFGYYLKLYQLSGPRLRYDFILFDEAQDANPVIDAIVQSQTCQKVMVGDRSQAIYGWNGAIDAMSKFAADHRLPLTQSFRFGDAIAEVANKWLTVLDANLEGVAFRLSGHAPIQSKVETLSNPNAVLCRTNAGVLETALRYQESGLKVAIVGGAAELASFARAAEKLQHNETPEHPDLGTFKSWTEVIEHSETDEGKDLKMMVRIVNVYGTQAILNVANGTVKEDQADVVVSTAHKAKGREWNTVQIHTDFPEPKEDAATGERKVSRTDAMLAYVAVTRAKLVLDNIGLAWIDEIL